MRADPELITDAPPQDYHLHFGLSQAPFTIEADTALLVLSEGHEQALDKLYRGLLSRKSFLLITGAPGTGKTLLAQTLVRLAAEQCEFLRLFPQDLSPPAEAGEQLSGLILNAAGISTPTTLTAAERNATLRSYLETARSERRHPVIVIDEAQRLTDTQLDALRHWSNLDDHQGCALQFLLIAHNSLAERLNAPALAELKQRFGVRCELPPLSLGGTQRYVAHRCALAGSAEPLFNHGVIIRLYSLTRGLPRLVNLVADALLLQAFLRGGDSVNVDDVRRVRRDLDLHYAPIIPRQAGKREPQKSP